MLISHDTGLPFNDGLEIINHLHTVDRCRYFRDRAILFLKDKDSGRLRLEGKEEAIYWAVWELSLTERWKNNIVLVGKRRSDDPFWRRAKANESC